VNAPTLRKDGAAVAVHGGASAGMRWLTCWQTMQRWSQSYSAGRRFEGFAARRSCMLSLSTLVSTERSPGGGARATGQEFVAAPVFGRPERPRRKVGHRGRGTNAAVSVASPCGMPWDKLLVIGEQQSKRSGQADWKFLDRYGAGIAGRLWHSRANLRSTLRPLMEFLDQHALQRAVVQDLWRFDVEGKHDQVGFALP